MKHSGFKIYLLIWLGTFISEIGTGMTSFALGIYIYQLTGQAASFCSSYPLCFFTWPLNDSLGRDSSRSL